MVRSRNRRRARSGGSLVAPRTLSGGYAGAAPARGFYPLRRGPPPEAGARVLRRLGPRVSPRARPRFRRGPGSGIGSSGCPAGRPAGCPARCRAVVPRAIPRLAPGLSRGLPRGRLSRGLAGDRFRGALAAPLSQSVPPPDLASVCPGVSGCAPPTRKVNRTSWRAARARDHRPSPWSWLGMSLTPGTSLRAAPPLRRGRRGGRQTHCARGAGRKKRCKNTLQLDAPGL